MRRRTSLPGTLICLLSAGILLAGPASATEHASGAFTRTFPIAVVLGVEMKDPGLGVFSSTSPCPAVLFSAFPGAADPVYYQSGRTVTNLKTGSVELPTGQPDSILINGPCPIPSTGPGSPVFLTIPDMNVHGPYQGLSIGQMVCLQGILNCVIDLADTKAVLSLCHKDNVAFLPSPADGKSTLANLAGSRAITCFDSPGDPSDGFRNIVTYYDGANGGPQGYCDTWSTGSETWGTAGPCRIQVEDVVPLGNDRDDTGYVVTCMEANNVFIADPLTNTNSVGDFHSHDYILVLDLDGTPENWAESLLIHNENSLQGLHDLGGKNGFPCPDGDPPPDKKGDFPIVPTPLSPKP